MTTASSSMPAWLSLPRLILFLLGLHVLLWTFVPAILQANPNMDVIEGLAWGREWVFGTYKHPPLQAWFLELATEAFPRQLWPLFLLSAASTGLAAFFVWRTARIFLPEKLAALAGLLPLTMHYYGLTAIEFNPNVLQLPLAAAAGYFFVRAVRGAPIYFIACGALCGIGLYAKYSFGLFALSFALMLIFDPALRPHLRSAWPWVSGALAAAIFLPQAHWLVQHDFLPFTYAASRTEAAQTFGQWLWFPFAFLLAQMLALLSPILCLLPFPRRWRWPAWTEEQRLVIFLAFLPAALAFLGSLITGQRLKDMWGMPFWNFAPLALLYFLPQPGEKHSLRSTAWIGGVLYGLLLLAYAGSVLIGPYFKKDKGERAHFPGAALTATLTREWQKHFGEAPLRFVIGDTWLAGNVAFWSEARPSVLTDGNFAFSPWVKPEGLRKDGGIVLWMAPEVTTAMPEALRMQFAQSWSEGAIGLSWQTRAPLPPVRIGYALIAPQP